MHSTKYILITIDVEDWFQVENFKLWIPFETWDKRELRVERNAHRLLNLFDSIELPNVPTSQLQASGSEPPSLPTSQLQASGSELPNLPACPVKFLQKREADLTGASQPPAERRPKATFFVLGWLAKRLPNLVREIHSRGHEVASHGINHLLSNNLSINDLRIELNDSKKLIEDIIGSSVIGFRAPNFSVDENVLKATLDAGYLYDSSYNSFGIHPRYGRISLNGQKKMGIAVKFWDNFFELPLSNLQLMGRIIPWSGGAYFRLIPHRLFRRGVQSILKKDEAYLFYVHPWEIDSFQPKMNKIPVSYKIRHYYNLSSTYAKLEEMIKSFSYCNFITCSQYLSKFA